MKSTSATRNPDTRVQCEGQTTTPRALPSEPSDDKGGPNRSRHWLEDYLTEQGAAASKIAKVDAAKAGIRERTLQRAVNSLGVTIESRGFPRVTWWQLPRRAINSCPCPASQNLGATGLNPQSRQLPSAGATATF